MRRFDDLEDWQRVPREEVTQEELQTQFEAIVAEASLYVGHPVLVHDASRQPEFRMGVVIQPDEEEDARRRTLTEPKSVTHNGYGATETEWPIRLDRSDAYFSLQHYKTDVTGRKVLPRKEYIFGHENISKWFQDNSDLYAVEKYMYVEMVNLLGLDPHVDPAIAEGVLIRQQEILLQLVKLAVSQAGLQGKIDVVYDSIGKGAQSMAGGLLMGMAPESRGEAGLRTLQQREQRDQQARRIERLKEELVSLGIDQDSYYRAIAWTLGLDLPEASTHE